MSIDKLSPKQEPTGRIELNDQSIEMYDEGFDLPDSDKKRRTCIEHLANGALSELRSDFILGGCVFPAEGDDQLIRMRVECPGKRALSNACRLAMVQYDTEGNEINRFS